GRRLHGRLGRGRFAGFRLGEEVSWRSRSRDAGGMIEIEIKGIGVKSQRFDLIGPAPCRSRTTGTDLVIRALDQDAVARLREAATRTWLTQQLALYLRAQPDVHVELI